MLKVFSIFDCKAEAYLQPWFSQTSATALRQFAQAASDEGSDFHRFASDYTLFEIGTWDPQTGKMESLEAKVSLACALEFVSRGNGDAERAFAPVRSE